jgi:hypothetical protein
VVWCRGVVWCRVVSCRVVSWCGVVSCCLLIVPTSKCSLTPPCQLPLQLCQEAIHGQRADQADPRFPPRAWRDISTLQVGSSSRVLPPDSRVTVSPRHCVTVSPCPRVTVSLCTTLHYVALRCVALRCVALRCVALRCVALRCVALRCVAFRAIVPRRSAPRRADSPSPVYRRENGSLRALEVAESSGIRECDGGDGEAGDESAVQLVSWRRLVSRQRGGGRERGGLDGV